MVILPLRKFLATVLLQLDECFCSLGAVPRAQGVMSILLSPRHPLWLLQRTTRTLAVLSSRMLPSMKVATSSLIFEKIWSYIRTSWSPRIHPLRHRITVVPFPTINRYLRSNKWLDFCEMIEPHLRSVFVAFNIATSLILYIGH